MKQVFNIRFTERLTNAVFSTLCDEVAQRAEAAGLENDAAKLLTLNSTICESSGLSRKNQYVEQQNDIVKMMKDTAALLGKVLSKTSDESELLMASVYDIHLKGCYGKGIREFAGRVDRFLSGLGDLEAGDIAASYISTLRILSSRLSTTEGQKDLENEEIKSRVKTLSARQQAVERMFIIYTKMQAADDDNKTNNADGLRLIFEKYHRDFFHKRKKADEEMPSAGEDKA